MEKKIMKECLEELFDSIDAEIDDAINIVNLQENDSGSECFRLWTIRYWLEKKYEELGGE